jgi:excisionase family DNA binding protein
MQALLSAPEAAKLLGIIVWTMRQWLSRRRLTFIKVGRLTKLRQMDIEAFIIKHRKRAVFFDRVQVA